MMIERIIRGHVQSWFDGCLSYEHEQKIAKKIQEWCFAEWQRGYDEGFGDGAYK